VDAELIGRALVGARGDAILAVDRDNMIRFWNPGACRIFGFTSEEAVGQSLDLIIPEALRGRHRQGFDHVIGGGETRYGAGAVLAVPAMTSDGRRISVEFTIIVLKNEADGVIGMAAILRDVSARFAELRALREKLKA
jgi:PAS domain S-box-containing protein